MTRILSLSYVIMRPFSEGGFTGWVGCQTAGVPGWAVLSIPTATQTGAETGDSAHTDWT